MAKSKETAPGPMTMADLAGLAGVSKITVSRALRDSPLVRESVRQRIKKLSVEHGYRLNAAARSLRTQRAHSITAVIEMDPTTVRPLSEPIVLIVMGALLQACASRGYRLVLTTRSEAMSSHVADTEGLILLGSGAKDEAIAQMQRFNLPLVVWGSCRPAFENTAFLGGDNVGGGRLVGEHLVSLGRKRILFLGDTVHTEVAERLAGLKAAIAGGDARVRRVSCAFSREASHAILTSELAKGTRFDAVVGCSDPIALGALDALRDAGRSVPVDVAVTGYDDAMREPRLTTVRQDWNLAGTLLADMMFALLERRKVISATLPVELKIRASTCG